MRLSTKSDRSFDLKSQLQQPRPLAGAAVVRAELGIKDSNLD